MRSAKSWPNCSAWSDATGGTTITTSPTRRNACTIRNARTPLSGVSGARRMRTSVPEPTGAGAVHSLGDASSLPVLSSLATFTLGSANARRRRSTSAVDTSRPATAPSIADSRTSAERNRRSISSPFTGSSPRLTRSSNVSSSCESSATTTYPIVALIPFTV